MKDCTASVDLSEWPPLFSFAVDGDDPLLIQLGVWQDGVPSPVWQITVDNPPTEVPFEVIQHATSKTEVLRAMFEHGVAELLAGVGSLPIRAVRYGEVPPGFRQGTPRHGMPAPRLKPGPHHLAANGAHNAWLAFVVPEGI
jgi:hypothetical protein